MAGNTIVVGVDGSAGGRRALRWALDQAAHTGALVRAVTAWTWDGIDRTEPAPVDPDAARIQAQKIAAEEVATAMDNLAKPVSVEVVVRAGRPAQVLADAAASANLLVLGSHGHSRLYHTVLGSVSDECVRSAVCPVVVVPIPYANHPRSAGPTGRRRTAMTPGAAGPTPAAT
jgi:nucleotide-binding universal stress UspA family protein